MSHVFRNGFELQNLGINNIMLKCCMGRMAMLAFTNQYYIMV